MSDATQAAKAKATKIIEENGVVVFSKSYCPYCRATKNLLRDAGAKYFSIELDQVPDGNAIQDALEEMNHQRSVPNIFINKQFIGGNDQIQERRWELKKLLIDAGAI